MVFLGLLIVFIPSLIAALIVFWLVHTLTRSILNAGLKRAGYDPKQFANEPINDLPSALGLLPAAAAFFTTAALLFEVVL